MLLICEVFDCFNVLMTYQVGQKTTKLSAFENNNIVLRAALFYSVYTI